MISLSVERFLRLPVRDSEKWQAAVFRMPVWGLNADGEPVRPWMGACVSTTTCEVGCAEPEPGGGRSTGLILDAIRHLAHAESVGYRPGGIEVSDSDIAAELRELLTGVRIIERTDLVVLNAVLAGLTEHLREGEQDPAALDVKGVTIDQVQAFAAAAREFYEAAPWQHLHDSDLLRVVAPKSPAGLGLASVMGAGGREFGIGFFRTRRQFDQLMAGGGPDVLTTRSGAWSLTFGPVTDIPVSDGDLWEKYQLPLAGPAAYPSFVKLGSGMRVRRPTPAVWAFTEGLLRALAHTTEQELDTGRWTKTVKTRVGVRNYELELPRLIEAVEGRKSVSLPGHLDRPVFERMVADLAREAQQRGLESVDELQSFLDENFTDSERSRRPARTPLEQAEELVHEARGVDGRRQLQLLRKALEVCPDCADAYVLLADRESNPERALEWYAKGVAAGARVLGPSRFTEDAGDFWGMFDTRPYMRALFGVAESQMDLGRHEEARASYAEMLRLNPGDDQGARYPLARCLLGLRRVEELDSLLESCDEVSAHWLYLGAIAAFVNEGDSPAARDRLAEAHVANPMVRQFLLGELPLPDDSPASFNICGPEEAIMVALETFDLWTETPGALDWLERYTSPPAAAQQRKPR